MFASEALDWDRLLAVVQHNRPELYRSWFEELRPAGPDSGELVVFAADSAKARYLDEQCREAFVQAAVELSGHLLTVRFASPEQIRDGRIAHAAPLELTQTPINADYTFAEFVVGTSNRLAHAASQAICTRPGALYNPLFIHGPSGLGKTHLLQAICSEMLRGDNTIRVAYISCESFVNDLVQAIAQGLLQPFREQARSLDVLVIDDVQFIANRESSQEELFHTFNALYQGRRQIILTADKAPSEIPTLEDRLMSRFQWGLVARIDPPDRETRQAILQKKARLRGLELPAEVADYIAEQIEGNIRLLEGALTKFITECAVAGKPPTLETALAVIPPARSSPQRALQVSEIIEAVSQHYSIRLPELLGRKRNRSASHPRKVAMYLARKLTPLSLQEIGMQFDGRDHSTVLHAESSVERERLTDHHLAETLTLLERRLSTKL